MAFYHTSSKIGDVFFMTNDFGSAPKIFEHGTVSEDDFGLVKNTTSGGRFMWLALLGWTLDLASKYFFSRSPADQVLVPGFLSLTDHQNYGLIGNFPLPRYLIVLLTLAALVLVVKALVAARRQKDKAGMAGLSLILAGALGNLTDRLVHGYVYDWILLFNTSVINLADIMITAGIIIFIYSQINSGAPAENTKQTGDC